MASTSSKEVGKLLKDGEGSSSSSRRRRRTRTRSTRRGERKKRETIKSTPFINDE